MYNNDVSKDGYNWVILTRLTSLCKFSPLCFPASQIPKLVNDLNCSAIIRLFRKELQIIQKPIYKRRLTSKFVFAKCARYLRNTESLIFSGTHLNARIKCSLEAFQPLIIAERLFNDSKSSQSK